MRLFLLGHCCIGEVEYNGLVVRAESREAAFEIAIQSSDSREIKYFYNDNFKFNYDEYIQELTQDGEDGVILESLNDDPVIHSIIMR